jgi:hypothetical protein
MEDLSRYSEECFTQFWAFFEKEYIETGETKLWQHTQELERQERELRRLSRKITEWKKVTEIYEEMHPPVRKRA